MDFASLTRIPLFRGVGEQALESLFSKLNIRETPFRKGDILAMQDEPVNRLIILTRGSIKGEMTDPSGRLVKVEDVEAPSPLAILFLFGNDNRFPVQATAREAGSAVVIPRDSVLRMLLLNPAILKNYLDISADFASRISRKLHFMSFRTIRQKLSLYLLQQSKTAGSATVVLDRPKASLAEYFGVSRPSLEREITRMRQDGLIAADRRTITILDRSELIREVNIR